MSFLNLKKWQALSVIVVVVAMGLLFWVMQGRSLNSATKTPTYNSETLRVERSSSGGFSGRGDGKNFKISNSLLTFDGSIKQLSKNQLKAIVDRIDKARFFNLNEAYVCEGCADQYNYTLSITLDNKSHTIAYDQGSNAPKSLIELDNYLVGLAP